MKAFRTEWDGFHGLAHSLIHIIVCPLTPTFLIPSIPSPLKRVYTDTLTELPSWSPPNNNACCHYTLESDTIDPQLTGVCLDRAA